MRRIVVFLIILAITITALVATTAIGLIIFTANTQNNPANWMSQMWNGNWGGMGGMMGGGTNGQTATNSLTPYFGLMFAVLLAVTIISIVGFGYYFLYPQIRVGTVGVIQTTQNIAATQEATNGNAFESVAKTLTEEELKVISVLNAHNGRYLQKYIKNETGLSRLKTHRIIARLAERGIVSLEKMGNTNQVYLANWLAKK